MEFETKETTPLYFEDVKVGMEIPPCEEYITPRGEMMYNAAIGQFCEGHVTSEFAQLMWHSPVALARFLHVYSILGRLMTDWIGPEGVLRKLGGQARDMMPMNDKMTYGGRVVKTYVKHGENLVDCELWAKNQDGILKVPAWATVALPNHHRS